MSSRVTGEELRRARVVAVIRGAQSDKIVPEAQALYAGGLRAFEVTVEGRGGVHALEKAREQLPDDALVGAGTVLDGATAAQVIAAGAQFIVSPIVRRSVIRIARAHGVLCILGGQTASEIHRAYELGSDVVKVFPAVTLGPQFIRELRGPLGFIPLLPTGGITLENVGAFLAAGAIAVGVGGALLNADWVRQGNWEALTAETRTWIAATQEA